MDKTAIQEIAKLAIAAESNALLGHEAIVIPEGFKLQSLELFKAIPNHFRAKYTTNVLDEFIEYLSFFANETTAVFINPETLAAKAIIDMGDKSKPLWGRHLANIQLLKKPAYSALLKSANMLLLQQEFIDFIEDWRGNINFYADNEERASLSFSAVLKTLRHLKISANSNSEQNIGNFSASRSALESIEIKAGGDLLPDGFLFEVIPYEGFAPVILSCQLRAVSDDKNVKLKFRIEQLDIIQNILAVQFQEKLINETKNKETAIRIFIGTMEYQS